MRIVLVTATVPPAVCGVGDYTLRLSDSLRAHGVDVEVYSHSDWSWSARHQRRADLAALTPALLHLQYPGYGFGKGFVPSWIVATWRRTPVLVTLHEYFALYSHPWWFPFPRGMRNFSPFVLRARRLLFTREEERDKLARWAPWIRSRSDIVPIGSNIPRAPAPDGSPVEVVYFGQIAPAKGLEEFLRLAEECSAARDPWRFTVVGSVPAASREHAAPLLEQLDRAGTKLILGRPAAEVAAHLGRTRYAYVPFPDGATAKRGSLMALLENQTIVLTRHGRETPDWIRDCTVGVDSTKEAREALRRLEGSPREREALLARVESERSRFGWEGIARRHVQVYARILGCETTRGQS